MPQNTSPIPAVHPTHLHPADRRQLLGLIAVLVLVDLLVVSRALHILSTGRAPAPLEAAVLLGLGLGWQVLLVWLVLRLQRLNEHYLQLQESFRQELDLSRQIMENDEACIIVVNADGRYVYANRATSDLLGLSQQEIVGRYGTDFVVEPSGEAQREMMNRTLSEVIYQPVTLRRANGEHVKLLVRVAPRWHGNRIVGAITYGRPMRADGGSPQQGRPPGPGR